jgi:hypothetical protein
LVVLLDDAKICYRFLTVKCFLRDRVDKVLFKVGGRANQVLQNLTNKNFGFITAYTTGKELEELKNKWLDYLSDKPVEEYRPKEYKNAKIPQISGLNAVQTLIVSLQDNPVKKEITKKCLKNLYGLEELPEDKGSQESFCNPDRYTFAYLGLLFGDEKFDKTKDGKWWLNFWKENNNKSGGLNPVR